ncbi:hypothetical protein [Natronorubrum sp. DTA28]|uniref:hypothetical protein n=1 Tax=Natronorubrum sp. DTA28 TaxID=3447019 RepID=UPI003F840A52
MISIKGTYSSPIDDSEINKPVIEAASNRANGAHTDLAVETSSESGRLVSYVGHVNEAGKITEVISFAGSKDDVSALHRRNDRLKTEFETEDFTLQEGSTKSADREDWASRRSSIAETEECPYGSFYNTYDILQHEEELEAWITEDRFTTRPGIMNDECGSDWETYAGEVEHTWDTGHEVEMDSWEPANGISPDDDYEPSIEISGDGIAVTFGGSWDVHGVYAEEHSDPGRFAKFETDYRGDYTETTASLDVISGGVRQEWNDDPAGATIVQIDTEAQFVWGSAVATGDHTVNYTI